MRILKITVLALLLPFALFAQQVKEEQVKMGKRKLWSFTAVYDHPKDLTMQTLQNKIDDAKLKRSSKKKGYSVYKGARWTAINPNQGDYYIRVKGKKSKATVYFAVSKGYDNFVTSTNDAELAGNITRFLEGLDKQIELAGQLQQKEAELKKIDEENKKAEEQLNNTQQAKKKVSQEVKSLKVNQ